MPELPEVESVRRAIAPALEGRRLEHVEITDVRLTRPEDPLEVAAELTGERVERVDRRGKYLIVRFASGRALLIHLRMTGSLLRDPAAATHVRAVLRLDDGSEVGYRDVRRFGTWLLLEPGELEPYLDERLGEEPLVAAFTAKGLGERLAGRRTSVKAALLDQRTLAGLGNIYVDEALWHARLNPLRSAGSLERNELRRLHTAVRKALELGIARQGSTLSDYRLPDGSSGGMQKEFRAYGRTGEPCDRCGTPLEKTRVAGRGTWFCPRCQPAPGQSG
jgi:formamidopyrimidine-DNA glycosylase